MDKKIFFLLPVFMIFVFCSGCEKKSLPVTEAQIEPVYVFAAASLGDALKVALDSYKKDHPGQVYLNLAGTNTLRMQIEKGSPADIFISADEANVDRLVAEGFARPETVRILARNSLVVISRKEKPFVLQRLQDLPRVMHGFFVIADPATAPAGAYSEQALKSSGAWAALEPRVVRALDVRAALAQVESGPVAAGMVYKTDAAISKRVNVVYEVPEQYHNPVRYKFCLVGKYPYKPEAEEFYDFLQGPVMKGALIRHGFDPL